MLQAPGSNQPKSRGWGGGGRGLRGTPFDLLTLRSSELMGIELWYWVQSDRMGPLPLGTPHVLNTWGQKEVFYTAILSSQIISLPEHKRDHRNINEKHQKSLTPTLLVFSLFPEHR